MRRITISCLALALILLGLTGLVAGQNVSIQLTPITYPIVLPDSGGTFDYLLFVTNQGGTPITATVWCMVTLPNDSSWGPVVGPVTQTLAAGQTQGYYRAQVIPPRAPYGYFMLHAYVGIYPDTIWAQDQFGFQHQAVSGTEQLWVSRYDGPGNSDDAASSLAIDAAGNIYVTGRSDRGGVHYDYATIKYNCTGQELWVARYNGSGNGQDEAWSLALDGRGNVYVTGPSWGNGTDYDYATIKHNSAGVEQWVARYNGPGNDEDYAECLVLDENGNVYVTGWSYGSGTDDDYATIKYDSAGVQQWVARYNSPGNGWDEAFSLALDGGGNVYVTGQSEGSGNSYDYATIKYNPAGVEQWVARYNGPGNSSDYARSVAVDGGGNVYLTGRSYGSGTDDDYATIKYNSAGVEQWVARYNGPGNSFDQAYSLALDGGGNAYVTGYSYGMGNCLFDYATIKYDSAGMQQWTARYDGGGTFYGDYAHRLALDGDGNVYVTGDSWRSGTEYDYATIKYNSAGVQQWVARYNGPGNDYDRAHALALDGGGNVYVTGASGGAGTSYDYATIKYSGGDNYWMPAEATILGQPLPEECALQQNYPNPFNASTALSYKLQATSHVSLRIYDTAGRLVETLVDGWRSAGVHELTFDASDLPSGMYVYRLRVNAPSGSGATPTTMSGKMILLK